MDAQPAERFDGTNDEMTILDADILDNSSGLTFYTALRPANPNGNPSGILGKRINQGTSAQYAYTWFFWSGDRLNVDLNTPNNRFNTGTTTFSNNTNYVLGLDFRGDIPAARRARVYSQGVKVTEAT